jgi:hypothetical protein
MIVYALAVVLVLATTWWALRFDETPQHRGTPNMRWPQPPYILARDPALYHLSNLELRNRILSELAETF